MTITGFTFTLCVSSCQYKISDIVHCIEEKPTSISGISKTRGDYRVFWEFEHSPDEPLDDVYPRAVKWAGMCADLLSSIDDAVVTLWCVVYSDSEFVGLAFQSEQLMTLGTHKISLVLSVYTSSGASEVTD
jgi:hypothetical protein